MPCAPRYAVMQTLARPTLPSALLLMCLLEYEILWEKLYCVTIYLIYLLTLHWYGGVSAGLALG